MKLVLNTTTLIVSLFLVASVQGQYFPSRQYMTSDGMPSNSVFDVAQASSGEMWFITKAGPAYFDATEWNSFPDSLELPTSLHSKIIAGKDQMWVAGLNKREFTLQFFKNGKWTKVNTPAITLTPNEPFGFQVLELDSNTHIILSRTNRLLVLDIGTMEQKNFEIEAQIQSIRRFDDQILVATSDGIWQYSEGNLMKVKLPYSSFPNSIILDVNRSENLLHLLGFGWYAEYSNGEISYLSENMEKVKASLSHQSSLIIDKMGKVFYGAFTTPKYLDRDNKAWHQLLIDGKDVNIGSTSMFCDRENNIWVSDSRGLFKFNVLQFMNYNKTSGLYSDEVTVVKQLQDSSIVLANPLAINILKKGKIFSFPLVSTKTHTSRILDIEILQKERRIVIAGNRSGLLLLDLKASKPSYTRIDEGNSFSSIESFQGKTYVSASDGVYLLEGTKIAKKFDFSSIRNMKVLDGKLFLFSNSTGIRSYDGARTMRYRSDNFDLSSVYDAIEYEGELLLATREGIATLSDTLIVPWKDVVLKAPVYSLLGDSKNRLWIGTDQGIYLYEKGLITQFDQNEGLSGSEINRNAMIEDYEGRIWIGTEQGVSVFQNQLFRQRDLNLSVALTTITAGNEQDIFKLENKEIPYELNDLNIQFRCYSYVDEGLINFRYRLASSNDKWISRNDAANAIVFNNMNPGDYKFEIQARFGNQKWGPSTFLTFSVKPPYYRTAWFILSAVFVLIVLIRLFFHYRYLLLIRQQKRLKELVVQRTKEIALLNEQLEEKVKERTAELERKNVLLEEYAYINAHHLRGPLTKIMSAIYVAETGEELKLDVEMIKILKDAVQELDDVIFSINGIFRTEE